MDTYFITTPDGNMIHGKNVHLRQGDVDGACGPYCIYMALIALGLIEREEVVGCDIDGRTNFGQLMASLDSHGKKLFANGTSSKQLTTCISKSPYHNIINYERWVGGNTEIRKFVTENIMQNRPVLLAFNWNETSAHWVLAIGVEQDEKKATKVYVLDPGFKTPTANRWNGKFISTGRGTRPFKYSTNADQDVSFFAAVALWKQ